MNTTSLGTGELIADALEKGAQEIILGIGGSATNDGGMGMVRALGYRFLNENNQELKPLGRHLLEVKKIDASNLHPKLNGVKVKVACDVTNPFYGENGAAHVYAKQKGASQAEISILDQGLRNFAEIISQQYNIEVQQVSGAGAAGGIGGGAQVFLGGVLTSGIHLIKKLANFDEVIDQADWIITGEGQLDEQTLSGKTIDGVITSAKKQNIPVAALCGSVNISIKQQQEFGLAYVISVLRGVSNLQEAMDKSYDNLVHASFNFANILR
jgi:glycerate kinase